MAATGKRENMDATDGVLTSTSGSRLERLLRRCGWIRRPVTADINVRRWG